MSSPGRPRFRRAGRLARCISRTSRLLSFPHRFLLPLEGASAVPDAAVCAARLPSPFTRPSRDLGHVRGLLVARVLRRSKIDLARVDRRSSSLPVWGVSPSGREALARFVGAFAVSRVGADGFRLEVPTPVRIRSAPLGLWMRTGIPRRGPVLAPALARGRGARGRSASSRSSSDPSAAGAPRPRLDGSLGAAPQRSPAGVGMDFDTGPSPRFSMVRQMIRSSRSPSRRWPRAIGIT